MSYRVFCDRPAIELVDGKPVPAAETPDSVNAANVDEENEEAEAEKVGCCIQEWSKRYI